MQGLARPGPICEFEAENRYPTGGRGPGFEWFVLPRHGKRPLAVEARLLLQAHNRCARLSCWSLIGIRETTGAQFAVSVCHTSEPLSAPAWSDAWLCENPDRVRETLFGHDPLWAFPFVGEAIDAWPDTSRHTIELTRFRAAWACLLVALLGLSPGRRDAP